MERKKERKKKKTNKQINKEKKKQRKKQRNKKVTKMPCSFLGHPTYGGASIRCNQPTVYKVRLMDGRNQEQIHCIDRRSDGQTDFGRWKHNLIK